MDQLLPKVSTRESDRHQAMHRAELELNNLMKNSGVSESEWLVLLNKVSGSILNVQMHHLRIMNQIEAAELEVMSERELAEKQETEELLGEQNTEQRKWERVNIRSHIATRWDKPHTCEPLRDMKKLCSVYTQKHNEPPVRVLMHPQTLALVKSADSVLSRNYDSLAGALEDWDIPPVVRESSIPVWIVRVEGARGGFEMNCLAIED